jgi:hypothetical protein
LEFILQLVLTEVMPVEHEPDSLSTDSHTDDQEDDVLAYSIGEGKAARVQKSILEQNANLVPLSKRAKASGFDAEKSLAAKNKLKRPADPHVLSKIEFQLMLKDTRDWAREHNLDQLPDGLGEIQSIDDPAAQQILAIVTNQLIAEGLWLDEYKDLTMSEAFPLSQAKADTKIRAGSDALEHGTFLREQDLTHEDLATPISPSELPTQGIHKRRPVFTTPMIYNLMRTRPRDLHHQLARRMIDTHFFEDHPEHLGLYRACYFYSRGVEDEHHFEALMRAGLAEEFPHYTFQTFRLERVALRKLTRKFIDEFFLENPAVKRRVKTRAEPEKSDPRNVWNRYFEVWERLTEKQKKALLLVYVDFPELTQDEIATRLKIAPTSLRSRLQTALRRFKFEFFELEGMNSKKWTQKELTCPYTHNGLWRYQSALWRSALFRVDPKTGTRVEIEWKKLVRSKNLDRKTKARIKAEIIESCPVPHFPDTEYFDGMRPTIISLGRKPSKRSKITG